jgi:hypothetical protein
MKKKKKKKKTKRTRECPSIFILYYLLSFQWLVSGQWIYICNVGSIYTCHLFSLLFNLIFFNFYFTLHSTLLHTHTHTCTTTYFHFISFSLIISIFLSVKNRLKV